MSKLYKILFLLLLNSTVFGSPLDRDIYLKLGSGISTITPLKVQDTDYTGKIKLEHNVPSIEVGIGVKLDENVRSDLLFNHYFLFIFNEISTNKFNDIYKINYRTKIDTLMFSLSANLLETKVSPYIGGGIGVAQMKNKAHGYIKVQNFKYELEPVSCYKSYNLAYRLTAGIDFKMSDNSNLEFSYSFFDFGYNKPKFVNGQNNMVKRKYQAHNITIALRYSL